MGVAMVGLPARMDELQDLWKVIMAEAFPTEAEREPGGAPRATLRTAALGWRLLAALGSAIETLAGAAEAVYSWRTAGQPTGPNCNLGQSILSFSTTGSASMVASLLRFADANSASGLMGYPDREVLLRHVANADATLLAARSEHSAALIADVFRIASGVVEDPFWRTFMKWKHGAAVTAPGVAPMWIPESADVDVERTESKLQTGIVVFDSREEPAVYVWPAERTDLILYSTLATQVLGVTGLVIASVLAYARVGFNALQWFEIEDERAPGAEEIAAVERLSASAFPIAALAGQWEH